MRKFSSYTKRFFSLALALVFAFSPVVSSPAKANFDGEILRFHVIANSNSPEDQALKLKVRDHVLSVWQSIIPDCENADDAEKCAIRNLSLLREAAIDIVSYYGYDYDVSVGVGVYDFPVKSYGNVTLPAGKYNAVRIVIGEGAGENWWCVMYPPLCLTKETVSFSEDDLLNLSQETKNKILPGKTPGIKIKFKLKELFKKG